MRGKLMAKPRKIGMDDLDNLGIDDFNRLYWKGERIVTDMMIDLPAWVDIAVGVAAIAAVVHVVMAVADRFGWFPPPRKS